MRYLPVGATLNLELAFLVGYGEIRVLEHTDPCSHPRMNVAGDRRGNYGGRNGRRSVYSAGRQELVKPCGLNVGVVGKGQRSFG